MVNILLVFFLPLFTFFRAAKATQSFFDKGHIADLNLIRYLNEKHSDGAYLPIILAAQEARKLPHMHSYYTQKYAWDLFDTIYGRLRTHSRQASFKILTKIFQDIHNRYEYKIHKYYTADSFLVYCAQESSGILWLLQNIEYQNTNTLNVELRALLNSPSPEHDPAGVFVTGFHSGDASASILENHLSNAILHWHGFAAGLSILSKHDYNPFQSPIFSEQKYPHQTLAARIHLLEGAFLQIFTLDHRLSGVLLHTCWNLMQYLKYISRLLKDQVMKQRIMSLSGWYNARLKVFIESSKDLLITRCKLTLTNDSRICRHSAGGILKRAHFISIPLISAGPFRDHFVVMKKHPDGFRPFVFAKDTPMESHLFVFLSQPIFTVPAKLEEYKQKYIKHFCESRGDTTIQ